MPSQQYEQFDFSLGEIEPDYVTRAGLAVRGRSLRRAKNTQITAAGNLIARPGTIRLDNIPSNGEVVSVVIGAETYMLVFSTAGVDIWNKTTRSYVQAVTGQPWGVGMEDQIVVCPQGAKTYIFHQDFQPRVLTRANDGTWSIAIYTPTEGIGGALAQPYYRFADAGVTLTPSGTSGSITLTASAAYFEAAHAGLRLRLQGREVEIDTFTDSTHVSATVIQTLFPTVTLDVTSSLGFEVGEVVTGKDSTAKGEVVAVPDSTHLTILMQSFTAFYYSGSAGEKIIGRNAVTENTAAQSTTTNAAVLDWTEQLMSDLRGWPGTGAVHAGRLWMGAFEEVPFGIVASAVNTFTDLEVGAEDADAIFEELSNEGTGVLRHIVSAEQLIVLTSRRALYYPESEANPIKPSGFQLLQIGPDGAGACKPALISEGVMFADAGNGSVMGCFPTGDVRRSWRTADMSRLVPHLINTPRSMAYVSGPQDPDATAGERKVQRFVYSANEAGDMAVVSYSETEGDAVPGWTPWTTYGYFRWVEADQGECWVITARIYDSAVNYHLEIFDRNRLLDGSVDVTSLQGAASGQTIATVDGDIPADLVYRCVEYPNATLSLVQGGSYIGEVETDSNGDFGALDMDGDIEVGFKFDVECIPWTPLPPEDERARRRKRRLSRIGARYKGKGTAIDGTLRPLYDATDDPSAAAPERDEWWFRPGYGWSQEPSCTITRAFPAPWHLLGVTLDVAG